MDNRCNYIFDNSGATIFCYNGLYADVGGANQQDGEKRDGLL